eukprot:TRINITY_DN35064_c0_g1_i3.p1 TRINITY_DN35064_c0_g1~~TRINITY_DN35064_c0_g1_i3.p1  ORF type:complete len:411 (-),score=51.53 TRINITY_DN35064_c0_g1_i3:48-1172(-)
MVLGSREITGNSQNDGRMKCKVVRCELDATAMDSHLRQELVSLGSASETRSMSLPLQPPEDLGNSSCEVVGSKLDATAMASRLRQELASLESLGETRSMSLPLTPPQDLGKSKCKVVGCELDATVMDLHLRQELVSLGSASETMSMSLPLSPPGDFRKFGDGGDLGRSFRAKDTALDLNANASATSCRSERLLRESALDSNPVTLPSPPGLFFTNFKDFGDPGHSLTTTGSNCDAEVLAARYGQELVPSYSAADLPFPAVQSGVRYKAAYDSSEGEHPTAGLPWPLRHVTPTQDLFPVLSTTLTLSHAQLGFDAMDLYGVPSVGSLGHPLNCNPPCKFRNRPRGCKDGNRCSHCHLCRWTKTRFRTGYAEVMSL